MNRRYPETPICAVGAVVFKGDSVLLVRRGNAPAVGKWSIPGGAVGLGETLEAAVIREVREETQLEVRPVKLGKVVDRIIPDTEGNVQYHYVIVDFVCEVITGAVEPGSDAAAAGFFKIGILDELDITEGTREVIREVYGDMPS